MNILITILAQVAEGHLWRSSR